MQGVRKGFASSTYLTDYLQTPTYTRGGTGFSKKHQRPLLVCVFYLSSMSEQAPGNVFHPFFGETTVSVFLSSFSSGLKQTNKHVSRDKCCLPVLSLVYNLPNI